MPRVGRCKNVWRTPRILHGMLHKYAVSLRVAAFNRFCASPLVSSQLHAAPEWIQ
jgi:hypothetical protein